MKAEPKKEHLFLNRNERDKLGLSFPKRMVVQFYMVDCNKGVSVRCNLLTYGPVSVTVTP